MPKTDEQGNPTPSKYFLTLTDKQLLDIHAGIESGLLVPGYTKIYAIQRFFDEAKLISQGFKDLGFDDAVVVVGEFADVSPSDLDHLEFDTCFFDFCGTITAGILQGLIRLESCLGEDARVSYTFYGIWRNCKDWDAFLASAYRNTLPRRRFIELVKAGADWLLDAPLGRQSQSNPAHALALPYAAVADVMPREFSLETHSVYVNSRNRARMIFFTGHLTGPRREHHEILKTPAAVASEKWLSKGENAKITTNTKQLSGEKISADQPTQASSLHILKACAA